ncbi:phosphocholine cytidylyltransferase family protein [Fundidesulfovibrio butyratiphilus]
MIKAVILAAGRGSRMLSLTQDRPKCLVEFLGRPLLDWQLAALRQAGVEDIAVVTGYRREALSGFGLTEFHNPDWADTNMVSSLSCAGQWLAASPCLVCYADIVYRARAVRELLACDAPLAVAYDPDWLALWRTRFDDPLADAETFRLRDGHIVEIGGKPSTVEEIEGQYMGLLRFTPQSWQALEALRAGLDRRVRDRLDMTGALSRLIARGYPVRAVAARFPWAEFDSARDLERVERWVSDGGARFQGGQDA